MAGLPTLLRRAVETIPQPQPEPAEPEATPPGCLADDPHTPVRVVHLVTEGPWKGTVGAAQIEERGFTFETHARRNVGSPPVVPVARIPDHQCRNWRSPVKIMATPRSFAAAIVCSSFMLPPGWTITATPASAAASTPSRKG